MPPFVSPNQAQNSRIPANSGLSFLAENLSLNNNNNNHSPPASNSGGQSPNQNNSPESPSLRKVDRTASRYVLVDKTTKMKGNNNNNNQYTPDKTRFGDQMSQPQQGLASPWSTNMQSASQNANASLHCQVSEKSYLSGGTAMPSQFDPSTLSYALAIQQAMLQQSPHSIQHSQPGAANASSNPSYASQLSANSDAQPGHFYNPIDLPQTIITERALQSASSYAFYRGNGQYTRLVPLDELPPIAGLPALAPMHGMIILPIPRQHQAVKIPMNAWAGGVMGPITPGSTSTGSGSSGGIGGRHFDAFAPLGSGTPGFGGGGGGAFPTRSGSGGFGSGGRMAMIGTPSGRREKIYCDKWVHDGVCAFAQQGCKYKHEMPLDVPTQRSLGLFHGLPSWWKREHGIEMKRLDGGPADDGRGRRSSEVERPHESVRESLRAPVIGDRDHGTLSSWRIPVDKRTITSGNNSVLSQPSATRAGGLFGNIGFRTTSAGTKSHLSNSYSLLDVEDPTSPVSSNGHGNNNGGIAASMYAPFSPTPGHGKVNEGGETIGGGHGTFSSDKGGN